LTEKKTSILANTLSIKMSNNSSNKKYCDAFDSLSVKYAKSTGRHERMKPLPGRTKIYGAIIESEYKRYALIQGRKTGKWSFPKGHVNRYETPFECVKREVSEEIGLDELPDICSGVSLHVGYYYHFILPVEFPLDPRDIDEVMNSGWFTLEEMSHMSLNVDASTFLRNMNNELRIINT
jgi:8-oxo-dGTP pyrophosphatase MutT (NUDIX family)